MDEQVWIGPAEQAPGGWSVFASLEAFLASFVHPDRLLLDDRAAVLREADFLKVYSHSPLSGIVRRVGPWRAGVGRTDPTWPLLTTLCQTALPLHEADGHPLTAGYEELAARQAPTDLSGVTVSVRVTDPELRGMWLDCLASAGAELVADAEAEVQIVVGVAHSDLPPAHERATPLRVSLHPDPWNVAPDSSREIVASVLDSPWSVMTLICQWLKRGNREAD